MADEKNKEQKEKIVELQEKAYEGVHERPIFYEIGEKRSHNFSLQFKTKDSDPPIITTSNSDDNEG